VTTVCERENVVYIQQVCVTKVCERKNAAHIIQVGEVCANEQQVYISGVSDEGV
jgi:hypothetical protein